MNKEIVIESLLSQQNFEHTFRIANMMSKSEMVPKNYIGKPQDIMVAMEMGHSMGLAPMQAIQNIAVINGKPSMYGDAVLAVCLGRSDFEDIKEEQISDGSGKITGYKCTVKRKGRSPVSHTFTIEHAQLAGLWGKPGPWKSYPSRMLQMRARGFALRDAFADALGGVRIAEEVQDYEMKDITACAQTSLAINDLIHAKSRPSAIDDLTKKKAKEVGADTDLDTGEIVSP